MNDNDNPSRQSYLQARHVIANASYKNLNWTRNWLKSVMSCSSDILLHLTLYNVVVLDLTLKKSILKSKRKKSLMKHTLCDCIIPIVIVTTKKSSYYANENLLKNGYNVLGDKSFLNETALMQIALSLDVCMVIKYWFALWLYLESIYYL